jgi:pre-mRNA-processing factor 6
MDVGPFKIQTMNMVFLRALLTCEEEDEEADKTYELVDQAMDSRSRRFRRCVSMVSVMHLTTLLYNHFREAQEKAESSVIRREAQDSATIRLQTWICLLLPMPNTRNLMRKKRRREERSQVVPDSVLADRSKAESRALRQQFNIDYL